MLFHNPSQAQVDIKVEDGEQSQLSSNKHEQSKEELAMQNRLLRVINAELKTEFEQSLYQMQAQVGKAQEEKQELASRLQRAESTKDQLLELLKTINFENPDPSTLV